VLGRGFLRPRPPPLRRPRKGTDRDGLGGLALTVAALTAVGFAVSTFTKSQVVPPSDRSSSSCFLFVVNWPAESTQRVGLRSLCSGCPSRRTSTASAKGNVASETSSIFVSLGALGLFAARTTIASQALEVRVKDALRLSGWAGLVLFVMGLVSYAFSGGVRPVDGVHVVGGGHSLLGALASNLAGASGAPVAGAAPASGRRRPPARSCSARSW